MAKVEISKDEIEAFEAAIECAIKSNATLQFAALTSKDSGLSLKDILESNVILNQCYSTLQRFKKELDGE
jgi:hypothetical protein